MRMFRWIGFIFLMGVAAIGSAQNHLGFDRNIYPGDAAMQAARKRFDFTGYWLNIPPGETRNTWTGKRVTVRDMGYGFLLLWNGKLDAQIKAAMRRGVTAEALGKKEGVAAAAAARREGFPTEAVLFLDLEEGGRLLPEQMAYTLAWTEAVARAGFTPGVYCSGQPVDEGGGVHITTADDIRDTVTARHLHTVELWVAQDACGPAPGCVSAQAPSVAQSGTPTALVWQFAQSPRRPEITLSCVKTYARDGNCYATEMPGIPIDLNSSPAADPSHGR